MTDALSAVGHASSFPVGPASSLSHVHLLFDWQMLDTWIVITAGLAAMACALPGVFLLLRRQSMMGDALSHTVLPGIVIAFLMAQRVLAGGWISTERYVGLEHLLLFLGAVVIGVLSAVLTEWVRRLGRVEASAALGVVFTSLFAVGLVLIRVAADDVHIDPDCVLYGTVETIVLGETGVPTATQAIGLVLLMNVLLVLVFFKELKLSTFDPQLATALGVNARVIHYLLMAVTAVTVVAAFEIVGSILVIAMLIVPPATAFLLTRRLGPLIVISLLLAACSALVGHAGAIALPSRIFSPLGFPEVDDASTAGMMAVASGLLFTAAVLFAPQQGLVSRAVTQFRLAGRIAAEDVLGTLYRMEEKEAPAQAFKPSGWRQRLAVWKLARRKYVTVDGLGCRLTEAGREIAGRLVRAHRLWESYLAEHFVLPEDHLHESAEWVEHYMDGTLREAMSRELDRPARDPHGRTIPKEKP